MELFTVACLNYEICGDKATFDTGNPLACKAALAGLDIFEDEQILLKNVVSAQKIQEAFAWTYRDDRIEHVRQQGMIFAFDIKKQFLIKPDAFSKEMFQKGMQEGVLIRPIGQTVYVMPPYILSNSEIEWMSTGIFKALNKTLNAPL